MDMHFRKDPIGALVGVPSYSYQGNRSGVGFVDKSGAPMASSMFITFFKACGLLGPPLTIVIRLFAECLVFCRVQFIGHALLSANLDELRLSESSCV
jgi:hypothetical protein